MDQKQIDKARATRAANKEKGRQLMLELAANALDGNHIMPGIRALKKVHDVDKDVVEQWLHDMRERGCVLVHTNEPSQIKILKWVMPNGLIKFDNAPKPAPPRKKTNARQLELPEPQAVLTEEQKVRLECAYQYSVQAVTDLREIAKALNKIMTTYPLKYYLAFHDPDETHPSTWLQFVPIK